MPRKNANRNDHHLSRRRFLQAAAVSAAAAPLLTACSVGSPAAQSTPTITPLPTLTPAPSPTPIPGSKIQHVVVFMKENHTFDNLFAQFPGANGKVTGVRATDQLAHDLSHKHSAALAGATPLGYAQYTKDDVPNYWTYARNFTLCDNFFSEVMGPSPANHLMFLAA